MKKRIEERILCIAFCAFLAVTSVLFFLLPKSDFSELEKRYLEEAPELSLESLLQGEFGKDVEKYFADHLPGRDFFVGLGAYFDLLTGRQVTKDIYVTKDGSLVESPVKWDQAQAEKNISSVLALAEQIGRQVDLMVVPSSGWALQNRILGISNPYNDQELIEKLYEMTDSSINCLDMLSLFAAQPDRSTLYYRTDHHWTSLGAYTAYSAYMAEKGRFCPAADAFTVTTASGFRGSNYSRAALWLTKGEEVQMWHYSQNLLVTTEKADQVHQGVFYPERLNEADMYTVFLDGNHPLVTIHNPDLAGSGSILVIRDSYANCLGTLLANSYETVVLVDLRYYKQSVAELYAQGGFDDVLVCYSLDNFMTDKNLVWLK